MASRKKNRVINYAGKLNGDTFLKSMHRQNDFHKNEASLVGIMLTFRYVYINACMWMERKTVYLLYTKCTPAKPQFATILKKIFSSGLVQLLSSFSSLHLP